MVAVASATRASEAMRLASTLLDRGIEAEATRVGNGSWTVRVPAGDERRAEPLVHAFQQGVRCALETGVP